MKTKHYIILHNESLKNHTSIKVGGIARYLIIPLDRNALIRLIQKCQTRRIPYYLFGNGSNLLISDRFHNEYFIKNTRALRHLFFDGEYIYAGSSIPLKKLVTFCAMNDLYCMEFLWCIPGTLGGAIYMNAGRGAVHDKSISKYIVKVEVFDGNKTFFISNEECHFKHRSSIFQTREYVILSCILKLPKQRMEEGLVLIREREKVVSETQDLNYPSAGTVFKSGLSLINDLKGICIGGAQFSEKNSSFIINRNNASFRDIHMLIKYAEEYCTKNGFPIPELEIILVD